MLSIKRLLEIVKTYKWLLLPVVPAVFLLIFLLSLFSSPQPTSPSQIEPSPTTTTISEPTLSEESNMSAEGYELEDSPETLPGFMKKETLSNGMTKYTFQSENPDRPDIKIVAANNQTVVFSRVMNSKEYGFPSFSQFKETYGEPDQTIQGTQFYGLDTTLYLYTSIGMAIVGNTATDQTYEKQYFFEMTPAEYLRQFGDLN